MKHIILLLAIFLFSCNDSATGTDHSVDHTDNDDTPARIRDSVGEIDSLKGR